MSDRDLVDVKDDLKAARDDAARAMSKEFEKLKDGLAEWRKEFKRAAARSSAGEQSGVMAFKDKAVDAVDSAKDTVISAKESCVNAVEELEEKIVRNPLTSMAVAIGVGYLYAKFTRRG